MRKIFTLALGASLLFAPAVMLAQEPITPAQPIIPDLGNVPPPPTKATPLANVEVPRPANISSSTPGANIPLPKLGPVIRNIASSTNAIIKNSASTTREVVGQKVEAIREAIGIHQADVRLKIEQKRVEVAQKVAQVKERAQERHSAAVQQHVNKISDRLASTTGNLSALLSRLETQVAAKQLEGADMNATITLLDTARTTIAAAQESVASLTIKLDAALQSSTPKTAMADVRKALKSTEDAIKKAKDSLRKVVVSLKTTSSGNATTTVTQ